MCIMSVTVEVSKLSGWLNADALCGELNGGHAVRSEVHQSAGGRGGGHRTTAAHAACRGVLDCRLWGQGTRGGAHVEHGEHVHDAGGVEAQRLVERRRELPRVETRVYDVGRGVDREAGGGGRPRCTQRAGEGLDCRLGAGHGEERTENMPYMVVALEVSKLSGWLNADAYCRESKSQATAVHVACRGGLDCRLGAGHGEERTENMRYMFVTPEVSQLEMSALKFCEL